MVYCEALLKKAGFPLTISYEEKLPTGEKAHYSMYCFLRHHIRRHVAKGNRAPTLSLLPKPKEGKNQTAKRVEIEAEFFGEDENDISDTNSNNSYTTDEDI